MFRKIFIVLLFTIFVGHISFSQDITLDTALSNAVRELTQGIPQGTKIDVHTISSSYNDLSRYIKGELVKELGRTNLFRVFSLPNYISQSSVPTEDALGRMDWAFEMHQRSQGQTLDSEVIISGSVVRNIPGIYHLTLHATHATTGVYQVLYSTTIQNDSKIIALTGAEQGEAEWIKSPEYFQFIKNAVQSAPGSILTGIGTAKVTDENIEQARFIAHTQAVLDIYRQIKPFATAFLPELSEYDFQQTIVSFIDSNYLISGAVPEGEGGNWAIGFIDSIFAYSSIVEESFSGGNYQVVAMLSGNDPHPSPNPLSQPNPPSVSSLAPADLLASDDPVSEFRRNASRAASENTIVGIGSASMTTVDMSRTVALFRAYDEISLQLGLHTVYYSSTSYNNGESVLERSASILSIALETFEEVILNAAVFDEAYINGEYIVVVTMPSQDVR